MGLELVTKKIATTSPATAITSISASVGGLAAFETVTVLATLTGATGGVLDVYLQGSFDGGVTWYEVCHFTQVAAAAAAKVYTVVFANAAAMTQVGTGTAVSAGTAVLTAGTIVGGHPGDQLRAVYVAGASTSAGAAQTFLVHGTNARR